MAGNGMSTRIICAVLGHRYASKGLWAAGRWCSRCRRVIPHKVFRWWWFKRWGIKLGPLQVTWRDLWSGSLGLEIAWNQHGLAFGFKGARNG
jgi:hypothetical protein